MGNDQKKGRRFFLGGGAADFEREERSTGGRLNGKKTNYFF